MKQINLYHKLNGHQGCVNTVEFNSTGDLLVSGSDDKRVILWNWATGSKIFSYSSGHLDNIFQTRIMPFTDDQSIVTSSADGQVKMYLDALMPICFGLFFLFDIFIGFYYLLILWPLVHSYFECFSFPSFKF